MPMAIGQIAPFPIPPLRRRRTQASLRLCRVVISLFLNIK